ncbi:MAG: M50 family metallopeptidase [Sedimenticola sp.]
MIVAAEFKDNATYEHIIASLESLGIQITFDRLVSYEQHLLKLGILQIDGMDDCRRDPFTGFNFRGFSPLVILTLWRGNPDAWARRLLDRFPKGIVCVVGWIFVSVAISTIAVTVFLWPSLVEGAQRAISGWGWLGLYLLTLASGIVHEAGHILACRAQGVRIRETGFAIYFLLPFAWTKPDSKNWERLTLKSRVTAILAGPIASLLFAAIGYLLFLTGPFLGIGEYIPIITIMAGLFGAIVTLMPIINGDGYLLIVEIFGIPNVRRKSFEYFRDRLLSRTVEASDQGVLYITVAIISIVGWVALWFGVAWFLITSIVAVLYE